MKLYPQLEAEKATLEKNLQKALEYVGLLEMKCRAVLAENTALRTQLRERHLLQQIQMVSSQAPDPPPPLSLKNFSMSLLL